MTTYEDPAHRGAAVLHQLADFDGKRVLEIGCGDGRLTWDYAHKAAHVTAMDPNDARITAAQTSTPFDLRERVRFLVSGIEGYAHPPTQSRFDIAIFGWSL